MASLLFCALTGFATCLVLLPQIIRYAGKKNLFVQLDQRKIHKKITPSMGGIAIFAGLVVSGVLWADNESSGSILRTIAVLAIPFLLGFLDDRFHLKPSQKILGQLLAASLAYFLLGTKITSLYGLIGDFVFPEWLSFAITVITIILLTNSFNLIDGIDGLAGTFSVVALLFFGIWFSLHGSVPYAIMSFALLGSVVAFLFKNWQPSQIFMGDTGSLVLGMSLSILAIGFLNHNEQLPIHDSLRFNSGLGTVFCVLIVPIVDTIRVVVIRVSRGISPLTADKRHIHHALVRIGKSHRFAVLLILAVHVFFVINAILLKQFSDWYVMSSVTLFSALFCYILDKAVARHTTSARFSRRSHRPMLSLQEHDSVVKL